MEADTVDGIEKKLNGTSIDEAPSCPSPVAPSSPASVTKSSLSTPTEEASVATNGTNGETDEGDARAFNIRGYRDQLPAGRHEPVWDHLPPIETFNDKDSIEYNLSRGTKLAIILNHSKYKDYRMPDRNGTEHDVRAIQITFDLLEFKVEAYNDLTVDQITNVMLNLQARPNLSCLAIFILTHGEEDGLLYAYEGNYKLDKTIIRELLPDVCPKLAGKPKMVFIQACQGELTDVGTRVRSRHTSTDGPSDKGRPYSIPNYSDLLIYSAAYSGHFSFRSSSKGSWFIQALCREIATSKSDDDLLSVLTRVSHFVAVYKESYVPNNPDLDKKKQIPLKQDTFIRKLYLKTPLPKETEKPTVIPQRRAVVANDGHHDTSSKSKDKCLCM
jgi:caspase 7